MREGGEGVCLDVLTWLGLVLRLYTLGLLLVQSRKCEPCCCASQHYYIHVANAYPEISHALADGARKGLQALSSLLYHYVKDGYVMRWWVSPAV